MTVSHIIIRILGDSYTILNFFFIKAEKEFQIIQIAASCVENLAIYEIDLIGQK